MDRSLAEEDLLRTDNTYEQRDTGQGLQRVQEAPRTSRAMHQLLHATQQKLLAQSGSWVGSTLIHLGDSNVPNSLMFIDKYSQVRRATRTRAQPRSTRDATVGSAAWFT